MRLRSAPLLAAGMTAGLVGAGAVSAAAAEPGMIAANTTTHTGSYALVRRGSRDLLLRRDDGGPQPVVVAPDTILVFPAIAYPVNGSRFVLDFHAVAFRHDQKPSKWLRAVGKMVNWGLPENLSEGAKLIFRERFAPFMSTAAVGSSALVNLTIERSGLSVVNVKTPQSADDGHLECRIFLADVNDRDRVRVTTKALAAAGAVQPSPKPVQSTVEVIVAGEEGFGVISDIDDTIKITNVLNKKLVVKETFFNEFRPTNTMSSLFTYLKRNLKFETKSLDVSDPVFYYLSASPWQLFNPIMSFLRQAFPPGELVLNRFDATDPLAILSLSRVEKYKIANGIKLLDKFPRRKFILIGDSGQKDPEIYSELYSKRPDQVMCILIRRVTGVDAQEEAVLNSRKRFDKAMEGVPRKKWVLFDAGASLLGKVDFKESCGADLGVKPTDLEAEMKAQEEAEEEREDQEKAKKDERSSLDKLRLIFGL